MSRLGRVSRDNRVPNDVRLASDMKKQVWKERFIKVAKKVIQIAVFVFTAAVSVFFYLANPSLFALGFIVGLVIDEKVRETVSKVQRICVAKLWVAPTIALGSFLALPVAIAAGSFICGAYVSSKIAGLVPKDYDPRSRLPKFIRNWDGIP